MPNSQTAAALRLRREEGTERVLDHTLEVFAQAAELPLEAATEKAFRHTYRNSARRAQDPRAWRLVGRQLSWWLSFQGRAAAESAHREGASSITVEHFREALRRNSEVHASSYCEPDVPPYP